MATLHEDAIQIVQNLSNSLREAREMQNDDLSAKGLEDQRAALIDEANSRAISKFAKIYDEATARTKTAESGAGLTIEGSTRDEWERVKMLLDAGKTLNSIVQDADEQRVHAIREWGGTYLEVAYTGKNVPTQQLLDALEHSTLERLASIGQTGARAFLEAKTEMGQVEEVKRHIDEVARAGAAWSASRSLSIGFAPTRPLTLSDLPTMAG